MKKTAFSIVLSALMVGSATPGRSQDRFTPTDMKFEVFRLLGDTVLSITSRNWIADTGSIVVPENRSAPRARSIGLPVHRIRAESDVNKGLPVFWLGGGPGQSNLHTFQYNYFIGSHDHVMVGYRGVDGDVSLECPEMVEVLKAAGDIMDPEVIAAVSGAYRSCASRLKGQGVDISGYTPVEVADDIEAARVALGYDKIILLAESYGTRVAYIYSQRYPDAVERMVMVGMNPPGHMVWDPYQNDSLIARYAALWANDPPSRGRNPDLLDAMKKVRREFPDSWLFMPIHKGTVMGSMNAFLFHTETAVQGFDAFIAAANGDPSGLWLISIVGSGIFPTVVNWGDNASKALSSDFEPGHDYLHELEPDDAVFGAPLGAFLWASANETDWPVGRIPEVYRKVQRTETPTLFLSGSLDLSTPAQNVTTEVLPYFPNGRHVVLAEAGHILDLWRSQPGAIHLLLVSFVDGGRVDDSKVAYHPLSFDVAWGFPVLAKLTVGLVLLLFLLVAGAVYYGVRRYRRVRAARRATV